MNLPDLPPEPGKFPPKFLPHATIVFGANAGALGLNLWLAAGNAGAGRDFALAISCSGAAMSILCLWRWYRSTREAMRAWAEYRRNYAMCAQLRAEILQAQGPRDE